jgi:uncharacterized GH25 family protein
MRLTLACCVLLTITTSVRAHFIWLVPEPDKGTALMIFSDTLEPDANVPVKKIAHTKLFARGGDKGAAIELRVDEGKDAFHVSVPKTQDGSALIAGVCEYGVVSKSKDGPYLVMYYPKTVLLPGPLTDQQSWLLQRTETLPLEIVPILGKQPKGKVLWHGKPVAGTEVVLLPSGVKDPIELKTDDNGQFDFAAPKASGVYGARARYIEPREGELGGKKFKEVRHYATITSVVRFGEKPAPPRPKHDGGFTAFQTGEGKLVEDPAATKLLADARAARAVWKDFPGFTANLTLNREGAVHKGHVEVNAQGKVTLKLEADDDLQKWARREIASLVAHRMPGAESLRTPCTFIDANDQHHPLGRAIRVLNDELHSSYRIRDNQVIEVNRTTPEVRFTITVLENILTKEHQYLPISYVVDSWDPKTGQLSSSVAEHVEWVRIDKLDLPKTLLIVRTTAKGRDSRLLTFDKVRTAK